MTREALLNHCRLIRRDPWGFTFLMLFVLNGMAAWAYCILIVWRNWGKP